MFKELFVENKITPDDKDRILKPFKKFKYGEPKIFRIGYTNDTSRVQMYFVVNTEKEAKSFNTGDVQKIMRDFGFVLDKSAECCPGGKYIQEEGGKWEVYMAFKS